MEDIKLCPFCGGKAKLTGRICEYGGRNIEGARRLKYRIRVKCNKCHTMGKPITTAWISEAEHSFWGFQSGYSEETFFQQYAENVIKAWNLRT